MGKPDSIAGVFLDADLERLLEIELPLVKHVEKIYYDGKRISVVELSYGEFIIMSDFHYGHADFSRSVLDGYLNYLHDHPNILIGLNGDIIEYGMGRRFIREDERTTVDDQITMFVQDFKPLAHRIKFMLWGNHEEKFITRSDSKRLLRTIALELGLKPGKDIYVGKPQRGVFVILKAGANRYGMVIKHSKTAARVNQDLQLKRSGSQNVASIIAHGHTHRLLWMPRTFRSLEVIEGKIQNVVRRQYLCSTGCFLKQPGYAEASDYPYTDVGAPIIRAYTPEHNLQEYDLTGCYRNYLKKGRVPPKADIELSSLVAPYRCPYCESDRTVSWGEGRRRCNECKRTFKV